jgi:hypothetical protein
MLDIDSNRFLHRCTGRFIEDAGFWWVENTTDATPFHVRCGGFTALVPAGDRLALTHPTTTIGFTAGPCSYQVVVHLDDLPPDPPPAATPPGDETDADPRQLIELTTEQRLLAAVLAEPRLRGTGREIPSNETAAARLGWSQTKFNRKLDWLCERLRRAGVQGMKERDGGRAIGRRARLVDHLLDRGLIGEAELELLDRHRADDRSVP